MREIYLIGVNHKFQLGPDGAIPVDVSSEGFAEFDELLRTAIARHGIRGIAEEMSLFALRKHFISGDSVLCRLAAEISLPHRYCDPDADTRKALGISSAAKREEYWIKELATFNAFPVLFVLGADHIEGFKRLLTESHFQPFIIARDWEPRSAAKEVV